jgi:murein DD-endopeptidase MepM/ murein hydrolase activator NlpD
LREPPGQAAEPVTDSGRRNAARPAATATSVAGQSVAAACAAASKTSSTVSSIEPSGKRSRPGVLVSSVRMKTSTKPRVSPVTRSPAALLAAAPSSPTSVTAGEFPSCLLAPGCLCSYAHPDGGSFVLTASYVGIGTTHLLYDGHAGYDYGYGFGVPIVAPRAGMLNKAQEDAVNGRFGFVSAWDKFHTFYVDHGVIEGVGYATWYLHASDLETPVLQALAPGGCAAVAEGEVVARVGNTRTGAPHLHFEVREYVPADGPEAASSRVFDPYGWQGAASDPWEDPSENPQAERRRVGRIAGPPTAVHARAATRPSAASRRLPTAVGPVATVCS